MTQFPFGTYRFNVRLGQPTDEVSNGLRNRYPNLAQNWQLIADCVAIWQDKVFIIEAIVRPNEWWRLAQLNAYGRAYPQTEEYKEFWDLPIVKILLVSDTNPLMLSEARHYGIKVVKWITDDITNYLNTLQKRQKTPRGSGLKPLLPE